MKHNKMDVEIIYGFNSVFEALNAGNRTIYRVYLIKSKISKRIYSIVSLVKSLNIEYKFHLFIKESEGK